MASTDVNVQRLESLLRQEHAVISGPGRAKLCLPLLDPENGHSLNFMIADGIFVRITNVHSVGFDVEASGVKVNMRSELFPMRIVGIGHLHGVNGAIIPDLKVKVSGYDVPRRIGSVRFWRHRSMQGRRP